MRTMFAMFDKATWQKSVNLYELFLFKHKNETT